MSHSEIRKAFNDKVRAYGATKGYHVVLQNAPYTPTVKETYLKTYIMPAKASTQTLSGDHKRYVGIFQIDIMIPNDVGTGDVTRITQDIQELFPVFSYVDLQIITKDNLGNTVIKDEKSIILSPVNTADGRNKDTHYSTPVWFSYRCDTN